ALRLESIQLEAHPNRTRVMCAIAPLVLFDDVPTLAVPVLEVFVGVLFGCLKKKARGEVRESFREPLVVKRSPSHDVSPPLMRHFMRRHLLYELRKPGVDAAQQHIPLG